MTLSAARKAAQPDRQAEEKEIARVVDRLTQQFPDLPAEQIEQAVLGKYTSFGGSPIRSFVPVLVERASRKALGDYRPGDHRA